jgi:hypothetical protein
MRASSAAEADDEEEEDGIEEEEKDEEEGEAVGSGGSLKTRTAPCEVATSSSWARAR